LNIIKKTPSGVSNVGFFRGKTLYNIKKAVLKYKGR